jgi:DNA replication and repair protein RecF
MLLINRGRDRELGYTTVGPHRADLVFGEAFGVLPEQWSRGQAKLVALALCLAQSECLRRWRGLPSLLLFDDLAAELDPPHQERLLAWVAGSDQQALVTGTSLPAVAASLCADWTVFHVEQGGLCPPPAPSPLPPGV